MLERVRFDASKPENLLRDLDRFRLAVEGELRRIERKSAARFELAATVSGVAGTAVVAKASFDTLLPLNPANGPISVLLPNPERGDAGRRILITIASTANACTLRAGTRLINTAATSLALPSVRAAYLVEFDGVGFWTVNDAS